MPNEQEQLPRPPKSNGADTVKQPEGATFVRAAEFKSNYANYARVNFSPFEVSILFGHAGVIPEQQDRIAIEMTTRVIMDVIEAKLLIQMLTNTITAFEDKYGQVAIPDDVKLPLVDKTGGA
jgi:hypothetical protein